MKHWKCPNCARERTTSDKIVTLVCLCGDYYEEVEEDEKEKFY